MARDIDLTDKYLKLSFNNKNGLLHSEEGGVEFYEDESGFLTSIIFKNPDNFKTGLKIKFKETYSKEADCYYFYLFTPLDSVFGVEILSGARRLAKN